MRISEILRTKTLSNSTTAHLDIELLLSAVLQRPRSFLFSHSELKLTPNQEKRFQILYKKRLRGEPIAYILGKKEFWSLELTVNEKVLIPRPETELLVEIILQLDFSETNIPISNKVYNFDETRSNAKINIAELGTGSGAIALALAKERPCWNITATDISKDALKIAHYNATKLQIQNIDFCYSNWCDALPNKKFAIIVSNPPYIAKNDPHLQQGDVKFEPKLALEAGDGLDAIKKIIVQAKSKLKVGGLLALEHGYDQSGDVHRLLYQNDYREITSYKDLANIGRIVIAKYF
jgi:release factor glutamine methyltransferase